MSRTLDKHVIVALKSGDHTQPFRDISQIFVEHDGPELLEFEILGKSHVLEPDQTFLRDGNSIGIPKLALVRAFIMARQIFLMYLQNTGRAPEPEELNASTAVMLLMDGEHLTAANTRKRLLLRRLSNAGAAAPLLDKERIFVDSLLTSRLHRHTKSPTLWNHRRWLLGQYRAHGVAIDFFDNLKTVLTSAERHPRNYYAWSHARLLISLDGHLLDPAGRQKAWDTIQKWCFTHHNDVSGWAFLYHIGTEPARGNSEALLAAFRQTLEYARTLSWRNESVWWFLRTTGARLRLSQEDDKLFQDVRHQLTIGAEEASMGNHLLNNAWQWYNVQRNTAIDNVLG